MRIAIISDVHANMAALDAIEERYDFLLCLGDLVDYGPQPIEAIQWVRERAFRVIRGNHDQALGYGVDCRCAPMMKKASVTTREWHSQLLGPDEKEYLRGLVLTEHVELGGATFHLAHAAPNGDLYAYHLIPDAAVEVLEEEIEDIDADFILLGHTHLPMLRAIDRKTIVNPGSVGQPRHGDSRLSYAVWEDGEIKFHRILYDVSRTITLLQQAPLPKPVVTQLTTILRTGGVMGY